MPRIIVLDFYNGAYESTYINYYELNYYMCVKHKFNLSSRHVEKHFNF